MKYVVAAALICHSVGAFTVAPPQRMGTTKLNAEYEPMDGEGKINLKIVSRVLLLFSCRSD